MGEDVHQGKGRICTLQIQGHSPGTNVGMEELKNENTASDLLRVINTP